MKKYILNRQSYLENNGGSKAINDCMAIALANGYKEIPFYKKQKYLSFIRLLCCPAKSQLLIQHPLRLPKIYGKLFRNIIRIKKFHTVTIIHDLEMLRKVYVKNEEENEEEMEWLKEYKEIIAHNNSMRNFLLTEFCLPANNIYTLGIFDYLLAGTPKENFGGDRMAAVIAGNLTRTRAEYLYHLSELKLDRLTISLYGFGYEQVSEIKGIKYKGQLSSEEIPDEISQYGWGIAWDGNSLYTCSGETGEYLQYINQHRISLYLASGIPVITWEKSGLSSFIKENSIGICVRTFLEIQETIEKITDEEYFLMRKNAYRMGLQLRKGAYFTEALSKMCV